MKDFVFDLQRFASITIPMGTSLTFNGVTYSAITETGLNRDSDKKISGIESGRVKATVANATNSPTITFDASDGAIDFAATGNGEVLTLNTLLTMELIKGEFTYKGKTFTASNNSSLAFIGQNDDYSFRNEDTFEKGATFTFTDTDLTIDSEHTSSVYTFTKEGETREIQLESYGKVTKNFTDSGFTLVKGSSEVIKIGDYTLTATAINDGAGLNIALGENGITLVPNSYDGSLDFTLKNSDGSLSTNLEVLSGSFTLGDNGKLNVAKGTELQINFSDDYIVNFKATDADGAISIGVGEINFAPNSGEGGLELSVTRDGKTRKASFDVTGSVTYKLDGSISLTKGTVVKNEFESGRTLTITANTDDNGDINFNPKNGVTITPKTSDALKVELKHTNGSDFVFNKITGSFTYSNSTITLANGTTFAGSVSYDTHQLNGFSIGSSGGETKIEFGEFNIAFTPATGASTIMENSDTGHGWTISSGTVTMDASGGKMVYTLTAKSEIIADIPGVNYVLKTAGTYKLNGMEITTEKDNTEVLLTNQDTVTFAADAGMSDCRISHNYNSCQWNLRI